MRTAATTPSTGLCTATVRQGASVPLSEMLLSTGPGFDGHPPPGRPGLASAFMAEPGRSNRSSGHQVQNPAPRNSPIASTAPDPDTRTLRSAAASASLRVSISR